MDLDTVEQVLRPASLAALPAWQPGDAFVAGGTWLFSEPQTGLRRLVDLQGLAWPALSHEAAGLRVAATCTFAALEAFVAPAAWRAAHLIDQCCRALLGSFKIRAQATVGGNLCLALPASPMAALAVALEGECTIWSPGGVLRRMAASRFIVGDRRTLLARGEVLCEILLSHAALSRRAAFRQLSLTPLGRSAALLIGTRLGRGLALTITAALAAPLVLHFATPPATHSLHAAIDAAVPAWFDDVHGAPAWRRRITQVLAAEICDELAA